jgi:heat shock protein HtpX
LAQKKNTAIWQRLAQNLGAQVFEKALREKDSITKPKISLAFIFAQGLSLLILLPPILIAVIAAMSAQYDFPNIFMLLIAGILLILAWYLWPKISKNDTKVYRRKDLPETFDLIDRIALELNAERIDGIHIFSGNNAYYSKYIWPSEHIIGIGALLWESLTPQECVAVIAHELGHSVSQDPARNILLAKAIYSIQRWRDVLSYDQLNLGITWYFLILFYSIANLILNILDNILTRLLFWESQASEYRADRCAVQIAGVDACKSFLEKFILRDLIDDRAAELYVKLKVTPKDLLAQLDGSVVRPNMELHSKLMKEVHDKKHTIDATHPPTQFRIKYVESFIGQKPLIVADGAELKRINVEIQTAYAQADNRLQN